MDIPIPDVYTDVARPARKPPHERHPPRTHQPRTARPPAAARPRPRGQAQRLRPADARRPGRRARRIRGRRQVALCPALRPRRAFHRRAGPGQCRRDLPPGLETPRRRRRSLGHLRRPASKQAAGGGRARLLLHHRHRTDAGGRHQPLRQQRALRPARSAARNPPVRWRDTAHAPGRRLGQRHALAAHRRRIRRPRSLSSRPGAGSHRPGRPPRPRRRSRRTGRGPGAARRARHPRLGAPGPAGRRSGRRRCVAGSRQAPARQRGRQGRPARAPGTPPGTLRRTQTGPLSARPGYWAGRRLSI